MTMNRRLTFIVFITTFWGAGFSSAAEMPAPAASDGLVAVPSRTLDQLYLLPKADLASYRKVLVDPAQVELRKDWLKSVNYTRDVTRWILGQEVRRITEAASVTMGTAVAEGFQAQGYEIVAAAGPGVMRLSPQVPDLWVNGPDTQPSDPARYFTVDAGEATLILEVRDSVTGTLLGRVVDRNTARQTFRTNNYTTSTSNVFWFETLVRAWARNCAKEFLGAQAQP
jgi:hypothetical protein